MEHARQAAPERHFIAMELQGRKQLTGCHDLRHWELLHAT